MYFLGNIYLFYGCFFMMAFMSTACYLLIVAPIQEVTGKSLSEALIFALTNPLLTQTWRHIVHWITSLIHENSKLRTWGRTCCVQKLLLTFRTISIHNMFSASSELAIFMYWTCNSRNNLLLYCVLIDARISASEKDFPVSVLPLVGGQGGL